MNMLQRLLAGATVMLLTTSPAWAHDEGERRPHTNRHEHGHWFSHWFRHEHEQVKAPKSETSAITHHGHGYGLVKAPEIDAASGTSAIALLTGALLLAGERSRSKRSS